MPSTRLPLVLVGLLFVAGCIGTTGPAGTPTPDPGSPTPGSAQTPGPSPTGTPTTTVPAPDAVDYRELPNETQRTFRSAVENGSVLRDASAFDGLDPRDDRHVRYEGTTYALTWDTTRLRAEYGLEVERADATSVDANESVVSYANLTGSERRLFDRARSDGGIVTLDSGTVPDAFYEHRYVEHRGRYYLLLVVVADVPQWKLRVEAVDSAPVG